MILYLIRHGAAVDVGENGVGNDFGRMLTEEGHQKTGIVAQGLKAIGVEPALIASSPLVRARETAEIMVKTLKGSGRMEILDLLEPGMSYEAVTTWVNSQQEQSIMLVGHLPDLEEYTAYLISAKGAASVEFKKASTCCIDFGGAAGKGRGLLRWLIPPAVFKALA